MKNSYAFMVKTSIVLLFLCMFLPQLAASEDSSTYKVLNPRGYISEVEITPLTPYPSDLNGKTVYLVTPKQKGSEIEAAFAKAEEALQKKYPNVKIVNKYKPSPYMSNDPKLWNEIEKNAQAFVYGVAPSCSSTYWAVNWVAELEKRGVPGVVLMYDTLTDTAKMTSERKGVSVRYATVTYPPQNMNEQQMQDSMDNLIKALTAPLTETEKKTGKYTPPKPPKYATEGTLSEVQAYFYEQGWTDGLPIIPPTDEKVAEMLKGTSHQPDEIAGTGLWPERWTATIEKVAINGVMAGCKPEYMPVLLAIVEAWGKGRFGSSIRSTNSFSYMVLVNGPIRNEINMNAGIYSLGPGNQANAAIGRALRLFIINLGGGDPGVTMMGTQGNPSMYTFCFPENEEASPWKPFSVERGYKPEESTIAIFAGGWSHVGNYLSGDLESLAKAVSVFEWPNGILVLMAPPAAKKQVAEGRTKEDVKQFVWENATRSKKEFKTDVYYSWFIEPIMKGKVMSSGEKYLWPKEYLDLPDDAMVHVYPRKNVNVVVVGGETNPMMQGWKFCYPSFGLVDKWR